ncbi:MAG: HIT domain-containing protein [Candidatus Rokubacteria bacterium]|nr:HIT domain-containing protein [Candidatus Rokubacteria bacterium]
MSTRTPADCLLCRILRGELTVERIVETDHVIGFMNEGEALSRGHCVFFPKRHAPSLHEADDAALAEILVLVKKVARALGVGTYNVLQNNGSIAGQTVFHAHVHLIPKWSESEGLIYERGRGRHMDQKEMAARIRSGLARSG